MKKLRFIWISFIVLIIIFSSTSALILKKQYQNEFYNNDILLDNKWSRAFGGNNIDQCFSIIQTVDGGYATVGWTSSFGSGRSDVWLIKIDSNGDEIWNNTYGGSKRDKGYSIQQTDDEGYIIVGYTESYGNGFYDLWLIKTDKNGMEKWNYTFGGGDHDFGLSVIISEDNNYIVTGYQSSFNAVNCDLWIIKVGLNGTKIWDKSYGGKFCESGFNILELEDGFIISGYTDSFGHGDYDAWILKTDKFGDLIWEKTYGGASEDVSRSIQQTSDGGFIAAGWTKSFGSGKKDIWLFKIDQDGNVQWNKTFGGTLNDGAYYIDKTDDNNFIVTGFTDIGGFSDFYLMKIDQNGDNIWIRYYGGVLDDEANSVKQTTDEGYIIGGWTKSIGSGREDVWVVRTDKNGNSNSKNTKNHESLNIIDKPLIQFLYNILKTLKKIKITNYQI
jgi:hypothetical protein